MKFMRISALGLLSLFYFFSPSFSYSQTDNDTYEWDKYPLKISKPKAKKDEPSPPSGGGGTSKKSDKSEKKDWNKNQTGRKRDYPIYTGPGRVVIILDTSGSMLKSDSFESARAGALAALDGLDQETKVWVITFSGECDLSVTSGDPKTVAGAVSASNASKDTWTPLAKAINKGGEFLVGTFGGVLMTFSDGIDSCGAGGEARFRGERTPYNPAEEALNRLKAKGNIIIQEQKPKDMEEETLPSPTYD